MRINKITPVLALIILAIGSANDVLAQKENFEEIKKILFQQEQDWKGLRTAQGATFY